MSEELHVPGTVHLVDLEGDLQVKKGDGNIILRPSPSSNPNDPLRWSKLKKNAQFFLTLSLGTLEAISVNWSGPVWDTWVTEFDCTYEQLNIASALCFIFLGVGCVFLQPTALKLGRRFVYICSAITMIIANVVGAKSTKIEHLYAVNILGGLAAAPCDSLIEISVNDLFFQHERATYLALTIGIALYFGSDIGPAISGYIVDAPNMGWRWCFWLQVIMFGVMLICLLVFMEDTTFSREDEEGLESTILLQIKSRETVPEKKPEQVDQVSIHSEDSVDRSIPLRTRTQKLQLVELQYNDKRSWLCIFYRPFFMIGFPAIIWCGLVYGAQMMWLSLLATTQSLIYTAEPYNFSASSTGLTNFAPMVGSFLGMGIGFLVDWLTIFLSKRNNGIMEPEYRLYAMILPLITNAVGLLAYGLGAWNGSNWAVSVIAGQGFLGFAMSSSGTICLTYAIDSYHKMASEGLVLMLFLRNMIGCGFTFAIQPWLNRDGLKKTTWLLFMLSVVINGSFIIMVIWGKKFRIWTTRMYYRYSDPMFGEIFH